MYKNKLYYPYFTLFSHMWVSYYPVYQSAVTVWFAAKHVKYMLRLLGGTWGPRGHHRGALSDKEQALCRTPQRRNSRHLVHRGQVSERLPDAAPENNHPAVTAPLRSECRAFCAATPRVPTSRET